MPLIAEKGIALDGHFNCDEIDENVVLSLVPRPLTTLIMATEMPAAIKPYSMAVAPDSSFRKALSFLIIPNLWTISSKPSVKSTPRKSGLSRRTTDAAVNPSLTNPR